MTALNLKSVDVAKRVGVSKTTVSFWLNGKNEVGGKNLVNLAKALQCSEGWLASGIGSPEGAMPSENHQQFSVEVTPEWTTTQVPVMDQAFSAGQGALAEYNQDFTDGYENIDQATLARLNIQDGNARIIKIRGDSMWPTLWDGDKAIGDAFVPHLISGKIFAFEFDGELKVKRFTKKMDGSWLISSDNKDDPAYMDEVISPHNAQQLRIIAQVKELYSREL